MVLWKFSIRLKNPKIKFLKKIRALSAVFFFFRIEVQVISTRLADLKKHRTPEFLLMNDFF